MTDTTIFDDPETVLLLVECDDSVVDDLFRAEAAGSVHLFHAVRFLLVFGHVDEISRFRMATNGRMIHPKSSSDVSEDYRVFYRLEKKHRDIVQKYGPENNVVVAQARQVGLIRFADVLARAGYLPLTWADLDSADSFPR